MFYIDAQHDTWLLVDNHTIQWTQALQTAGTSLGTYIQTIRHSRRTTAECVDIG